MEKVSTLMRSLCFTTLVTLIALSGSAQVSNYSFSQSTQTYSSILSLPGGTIYGTSSSDDQRFVDSSVTAGGTIATGVGIPIGFNFVFNQDTFDRIAINNNGWICFGKSSLTPAVDMNSSSSYYPLTSTYANSPTILRDRVAGVSRDLQARTGSTLKVMTVGTAPNRFCVIEWSNYRRYGQTGDTLNFQIGLAETTNQIAVSFGNMVFSSTSNNTGNSSSPQIGLGGSVASDFNSRTTTTDWNNTTAATLNTQGCDVNTTGGVIYPASGTLFLWTPPAICSGAPTAGTTVTSSDSVCSGVGFTLSLNGTTSGVAGLTYQWLSSTDSLTWSYMAGATSATATDTITQAAYFRCIVTCSGSGLADTSNAVIVNLNPFYKCYCLSSTTSVADEDIYNVTLGSLNNTSNCSTTGTGASVLNEYSDYTNVAAPSLNRTVSYPFSVQVGTCGTGSYSNSTAIYIDWNQNGLFTDSGEQVYLSASATSGPHIEAGNITIPGNAVLGITGMRVITSETSTPSNITPCGTYGWGETEDYLVNIGAAPAGCSGTPTAGVTVSSTDSTCLGSFVGLSLNGTSNSSGLSYQWISSPDSLNWTYITGDTTATASDSVIQVTYYRCIVTCVASGLADTSNPVSVYLFPISQCYCISSATSTSDEDILNVTLGTLNNTSSCSTTGTGASVLNEYSDYTDTVAAPALQQSVSYPFSVQVGTCGSNWDNSTAIYIDWNQNGSFADSGDNVYLSAAATNGPHLETGTITVPLNAPLGQTRMRVITVEDDPNTITPCGTYDWGETEDYLVNITAAPACTPPTSVSVATGDTFAVVTFASTGLATSIEYGPSGFAPGTGTLVSSISSPYTIGGLVPQTAYSFYLQDTCSGSVSPVIGPFTFTTACSPYPTPGNGLANAIVVSGAFFTDTVNTLNCYGNNSPLRSGNDVFFRIPGDSCVNSITVALCGSDYDTYLYVLDSTNTNVLYSNDDGCGSQSILTFTPDPGSSYVVVAEPYSSGLGGTLATTITRSYGTLQVASSSISPSCQGVADGSAWVTITANAFAPVSYLWSNNATTDTISNITSGTYYVTVTGGCGTVIDTLILTPAFNATSSSTAVACYGGSDGAVDVSIANGTAPYTYLWSNADTTQDLTGLTAGSYNLTATESGGCSVTLTAVVSQPDSLLPNLDTLVNEACFGDNSGMIGISVTGGTSPYHFNWSNNDTTEDVSGLAAGDYTITITDAHGCTFNSPTVTITEPDSLLPNLDTLVNVACFGDNSGMIGISVTGGTSPYSFNWSNNDTTEDVSGLAAGDYTVTITDAHGCTFNSPTVTITGPSTPLSASSTSTDQIQNGSMGTINLSVTGGVSPYNFNWSNGDTTEDLSGLAAGVFTCTITDANGCSLTVSDTVNLIIGIGDVNGAYSLSMYPNPTQNEVTIDINLPVSENVSVAIYSVEGKLVRSYVKDNTMSGKFLVNFAGEAEGVYVAKITVGDNTTTHRIVVAR